MLLIQVQKFKEFEKLEVYSQKLIQENQRILKEYDKADAYIKKSEEMHQNISKELSNNIKELNDTLDEIRASASYRLGAFMTAVPRKIKNIIKKQKHK